MTADTPVARVTAWVNAYQAQGFSTFVVWGRVVEHDYDLCVDDIRALLDIIEETCPDHVACNECETPLCATCGVGDLGDCPHVNLCAGCVYTGCTDCAAERATADLADEQRAYAKEAGL